MRHHSSVQGGAKQSSRNTQYRSDGNRMRDWRARKEGDPLPAGLRASLEQYFKSPLDRVRMHSDPASQREADRLKAGAFTLGQNIHLGSEALRAGSKARSALLAHEVVHTIQQGAVSDRIHPTVGPQDDPYEQQAEALAKGFSRYERNPHDRLALGMRDVANVQKTPGGRATIQCGKVPTHFGEFEDFKYKDLTNAAGKKVGVEMYLKFHPGTNVSADLIGLTQVAEGKRNGVPITQGLYGLHSATSGAGVGYFIDRLEGFPNPIYPTTKKVVSGGSASNLADYETTSITALTATEQATRAASTGITGVGYKGWGQHGFSKVVSGKTVTQDAELYDAPVLGGAGADSEQVFETTALALSGSQKDTYYGSVEWGWRIDSKGAFTRIPLKAVSQGVPSATFLTAANIWNPSKVSLGFKSTIATDLLDGTLTKIGSIPKDAELEFTGRSGTVGSKTYVEVKHSGTTGVVDNAAVQQAAIGAATVDLPVPMVQTISNPLGSTMILKYALGSSTVQLPWGTRVVTTASMLPTPTLPNHEEGEVADGPLTGTKGYFFAPDLKLEALGKR
ncbi:MAG TPA: DUF4157 domain-containing protein [Burkholderiales bacterium]|nr:DUF4157 domain-containing protein [Burkholderiales bacterium]